MNAPTPLSAIKERVDRIRITGALRDSHWLLHEDNCWFDGATILFVADNLESAARELWPRVSVTTPRGMAHEVAQIISSPETEP